MRVQFSLLSATLGFLFLNTIYNFSYAQTSQSTGSSQTKIILTEEKVKELILKQGLEKKEVEVKYGQYALAPSLILSQYNWNLTAESGYEWDNSVTVLSTSNSGQANYQRFRTTVGLNRYFTTGTYLGFELSRLAQDIRLPQTSTSTTPRHQVLGIAGVVLEQALWGNFLGAGDRGLVRAAQLTYDAQKIERLDEIENVIISGVQQYWTALIAQKSYKEAINARDRYKQIAANIQKNTRLGNTNPGDLPQVRAELESKEQNVDSSFVFFQSEQDKLLTLLNLDPNSEVEYEGVENVKYTQPVIESIDTKSLRSIQAQTLRVQAASEAYEASKTNYRPKLNLVGKAYSSGIGTDSDMSQEQMLSGTQPKYYIGLRLQHTFGDDINEEQIRNKRLAKELETIKMERSLLNVENRKSLLERNVLSAYTILESTQRQKAFRKTASDELAKSYNLGRVDISSYITALNNYYTAEVQYTEAVANLKLAEKELLAFKDQLVP